MRPKTILLTLPLILLAACGGQQPDNGVASATGGGVKASPSASSQADGVKFAQCMREQGVDMADPEPGEGTLIRRKPGQNDKVDVEKAMKACEKFSPVGPGKGKVDPKFQDAMLKYTACMREQGIDMPDPDFSGGRVMMRAGKGQNVESPAFKKAMKACEALRPGMGARK